MIQFGPHLITSFLNEYTTVRASVNGKAISANFAIYDQNNNLLPVFFHKPPELNYPSDGFIECSFDPLSTIPQPGRYTMVFDVEYERADGSTERVTLEQEVEFQPRSIIQWYIDELRMSLGDYVMINKFLPNRNYIKPAEVDVWKDEELYTFLNLALQDINNAAPPTIRFHFADAYLPVNLLIYGAMVRALLAAGLLEVYNFYETNAPIRVTVYKGDKLKDFANWVNSMYLEPLKEWKRNFAYYTARPKVMVLTKMPFRVIRPLNMLFGYHNFFTG
jgi:hypothetical protein